MEERDCSDCMYYKETHCIRKRGHVTDETQLCDHFVCTMDRRALGIMIEKLAQICKEKN